MRPLRRSSSRIQRWVQDQQKRHSGGDPTDSCGAYDDASETDSPSSASNCNPWLAYPHLSGPTLATERDDLSTVAESYVFVEEDEVENELLPRNNGKAVGAVVTLVSVTLHVIRTRR